MNNNLDLKQAKIDEIKGKIGDSKSVVFVEFKGTTVEEDSKLRSEIRSAECEYKVYKNTLVLRALKEMGIEFNEKLAGTTSLAFAKDEVSAAKVLLNMGKSNKNLSIKYGLLENMFVDKEMCEKLGALPTKDVLISQLMSVILAPITKLACTVKAIADKN